jgi:hypothetical protein
VKRPRLLAGLLVAVTVAVVVVATVVVSAGSSPPPSMDIASTALGAVTVQRRDLVDTDTESGTVGYANPQTVYDRLSGTITWLPAVGQVIEPGHTLYGVNGRPVVLFDGALSAYRALSAKDSGGQDILQLNRDLVQMGFADGQIRADDAWQTGTTDAVERWQASLGEKPTGKIALGWIVFLPGPQRVTQLATTCGAPAGGGSGSVGGAGASNGCGIAEASTTTTSPRTEFVDLTTSTTTTTPTPTAPTTTPTTPTSPTPTTTTSTKPRSGHRRGSGRSGNASGSGSGHSRGSGESSSGSGGGNANASRSGGGSGAGKGSTRAGGGEGAGGASAILQTTSTKLLVTVDLAASSQREAVVGSRVTVEMPNGSTVGGTITAVSAVAENSQNNNDANGGGTNGSSGSGGASATVPVTITLDQRVRGAGLDQAPVSVNFAQAKASNVLSVPVTALIATAGQSYAVQESGAPRMLIPVTTGLFAAGYVQISGAGVHAGLEVTDSQG